ncbi:MAG: hypothetical protein WBA54_07970 [Acidaminobacteraceae bacterium]
MVLAIENNGFNLLSSDELFNIDGGNLSGALTGIATVACGVAAVAVAISIAPVSAPIAVVAFYAGSAATAIGGATTLSNTLN